MSDKPLLMKNVAKFQLGDRVLTGASEEIVPGGRCRLGTVRKALPDGCYVFCDGDEGALADENQWRWYSNHNLSPAQPMRGGVAHDIAQIAHAIERIKDRCLPEDELHAALRPVWAALEKLRGKVNGYQK